MTSAKFFDLGIVDTLEKFYSTVLRRSNKLSHLAYADDHILFVEANKF